MTAASVFFAFRDAPERRAALEAPGSLDRYRLFGLDEIVARGITVRHNLTRDSTPLWARAVGRAANAALDAAGGLGGDFGSVLPSLAQANDTDVVFSTVDTVGIPLLFLKRAAIVRSPLVYVSIGLPERLARLRNERVRRLFKHALASADAVIAYAVSEADELRRWTENVVFVPFGVDTDAFAPEHGVTPRIDVLSVGADPLRDFELLLQIAANRPERSFHIVTTTERAHDLGAVPANVAVETDVPLETVRERYAQSRAVALPVRANSYSGATTTLLQAMAMAKPVVVSRTKAIKDGYELVDGVNCRLFSAGDVATFDAALTDVLSDARAAASLGSHARDTVVRSFSWTRYTDALWNVLRRAAE